MDSEVLYPTGFGAIKAYSLKSDKTRTFLNGFAGYPFSAANNVVYLLTSSRSTDRSRRL
jgi:hypothetical protein